MKEKIDRETIRLGNLASLVAEHFSDYVIVARIKDGLLWRYSDRTFAIGCIDRLKENLLIDEHRSIEEKKDNDNA